MSKKDNEPKAWDKRSKKKEAKKKPKASKAPEAEKKPVRAGIPATALLKAESTRLAVLKYGMPEEAQDWISFQVNAYELAAAFLESLGAPERLQRYVLVEDPQEQEP